MPKALPAKAVADILVTAGCGTFAAVSGWGIFIGPLPKKPDTCILVNSTGGRNPFPNFLLDFPSVQVMVRGSENGHEDAWDKASACVDALLGMSSTAMGSDTYLACNQIGDISFLGLDENQRPLFSANFSFIVEPASGTHRVAIS